MQQLPETTKSRSAEDCAREILDSVPCLTWFIRRQMRSHRGGLSLAQFRSLVRVNQRPPASLSAVAEHLGSSLPTTSRIVTGLAEKGLMVRHGCIWDRRQVSLELTTKGREVLAAARKATQHCMELELNKLASAQRGQVVRAMRILRELFGPAPEPLGAKAGARRKGGRQMVPSK